MDFLNVINIGCVEKSVPEKFNTVVFSPNVTFFIEDMRY